MQELHEKSATDNAGINPSNVSLGSSATASVNSGNSVGSGQSSGPLRE
jgi:hypothetical protein